MDHRTLGSAPVGPAVRPIRNLDGQQNLAHPEILGASPDTPHSVQGHRLPELRDRRLVAWAE